MWSWTFHFYYIETVSAQNLSKMICVWLQSRPLRFILEKVNTHSLTFSDKMTLWVFSPPRMKEQAESFFQRHLHQSSCVQTPPCHQFVQLVFLFLWLCRGLPCYFKGVFSSKTPCGSPPTASGPAFCPAFLRGGAPPQADLRSKAPLFLPQGSEAALCFERAAVSPTDPGSQLPQPGKGVSTTKRDKNHCFRSVYFWGQMYTSVPERIVLSTNTKPFPPAASEHSSCLKHSHRLASPPPRSRPLGQVSEEGKQTLSQDTCAQLYSVVGRAPAWTPRKWSSF